LAEKSDKRKEVLILGFLDKIEEILKKTENAKIPFIYFIFTFFSAVILRNFLEIFSTGQNLSFEFFSHFDVSYVFLAMALIIIFHYATKESVQKVSRMVLTSFIILIIVPVIDIAFSLGTGYKIAYIEPTLLNFFTFFGPIKESGASLGMRIEIAIAVLFSFIYFFIKNRNTKKSLIFLFLTYCLIFFYCSFVFIAPWILIIPGIESGISEILIENFYLLFIFLLGVWLFFLYNKGYFIEILKDLRILRLIHYELMFVFGAIFAMTIYPGIFNLTGNALFYWIFLTIAVISAWLFAITTNNIEDCKIDSMSNKKRPTVTGKIPLKDYKKLSCIFLIVAIVYSSKVNFSSLFLILLFTANSFMYSMPPLRLKRITFFSKFFISLNSLALFIMGYNLITGSMNIPGVIAVFFLVFFTAAINFIDIKDYEGDKKAGIKTIPVVFGLRNSKIIIGLFFLMSYPALYIVFRENCLMPVLIVFGLAQFFLINKKNYNEKQILTVYLFSLVFLVFYLIFKFKVIQGI